LVEPIMNEINRVVRRASWRLAFAIFASALVWTLTVAVVGAMVCIIVERLFAIAMPWKEIAIYAPLGAVALAAMWAAIKRPAALTAARQVDEGANLKETLSTALSVGGSNDGWCRAVVESASRTAVGVDVRRAIPLRAPSMWPAPLTAGLALVVLYLVFPVNLLKAQAKVEETQKALAKVEEVRVEVEERVKKVEEIAKKAGLSTDKDPDKAGAEADEKTPKNPEEIRRAAIKKMESMKDQLENLKNSSEKAQMAESLKEMMKQIRQPGPGPLADVAGAMTKGDFKAAQEALDDLAKQMASGEMKEEDKKQLEKQLDRMKDALQQMATNQKKAEEMLEKAVLDKALAKATPEQIKQALEAAKNLTPEQKQQLENSLKSQQQAQSQCQNMGSAMDQMAQGMKKQGGEGKEGTSQETQKGMEKLQEQLSASEMMQQEANSLDAAMGECQSQMDQMMKGMGECENPGMGQCEGGLAGGANPNGSPFGEGDSEGKEGSGYGQAGRANGGRPDDAAAAEKWSKRNFKTALGAGPTIGTMLVQGEQIKGESRAQFQATADAAEAQASEAIQNNTIPREYHDAIKHYFGELKKKVAAQGGTPTAAPATDAKPAAAASNDKPSNDKK